MLYFQIFIGYVRIRRGADVGWGGREIGVLTIAGGGRQNVLPVGAPTDKEVRSCSSVFIPLSLLLYDGTKFILILTPALPRSLAIAVAMGANTVRREIGRRRHGKES